MKLYKKFVSIGLSLALALSAGSVSSFAADLAQDKTVSLTVAEAAKKAIENDESIKRDQETEELADDNYDAAYDSIFNSLTVPSMINAEANLLEFRLGRALNIENIQAQKENVEYTILTYFNDIINAEKDLEVFKAALAIQKKDLDILALKLSLGMASQLEYDTAALAYEKAVNAELVYVHNIDKAYRDLNSAMGEPLDQKYELVLNLQYKPVEEVNLTQYSDTFVNKSLLVQMAEDAKEVAEYRMDNYRDDYNPLTGEMPDNYNQEQRVINAFSQASRELDDTKQSIKEGVIDTYNSLRDMEINIKAQELDIETDNKQLSILEKQLELGQKTQLDVDKMKYNIMDKEETLRQAKNSYALLATAFANPNLLTGGAAQSAAGSSQQSSEPV